MKIKTESLSGAALDWAVASALNMQYGEDRVIKIRRTYDEPTAPAWIEYENSVGSAPMYHRFTPSTSWDQAGAIIQRECIGLLSEARDHSIWVAKLAYAKEIALWSPARLVFSYCLSRADTPLIAVMRCYVMSKLGDEVEIPEELCQ